MIMRSYERAIFKRYLLPQRGEGFIFVAAAFSFTAVMLVFVLVSILGTVNGLVLGSIRLPYALGLRNMLPGSAFLRKVSPALKDMPLNSAIFALAVSGATRSALFPDLPSLQEAGVAGYDLTAWQVLFAKPGTPPEICALLESAARRAVADPAVQARLVQVGVEVWPDSSPAAAAAHVRNEVARWAPIVAAMNLNPG